MSFLRSTMRTKPFPSIVAIIGNRGDVMQVTEHDVTTRLGDLIRSEPNHSFKFPAWLDRLVSVGIITSDLQVASRQRFTNVAAYATAVTCASHLAVTIVYAFAYAFRELAVVYIYFAIMAVAALCVHRLHRFGANTAANTLLSLILMGDLFSVWILGPHSGLHIYFMLAGAMLFMFGIEQWRLFLVWFILASTALIFVMLFAPEQGLVLVMDVRLRQILSSQAMINTMAINAVMIFYALAALGRKEKEREQQHIRLEALVETVMPPSIAARLKSGEERIADRIENLSVLFADLVDFTGAAHNLPPGEVVDYLDSLVRAFDALCEAYGAERIKTIGDSYMAVSGLRGEGIAGAIAIARLALAMLETSCERPPLGYHRLTLRIGLHCGPATAGVIGERRIAYDVWGDAVNIASRMESQGVAGRIQLSEAFHSLTEPSFIFEERGTIDLKGIGASRTFFLIASREGHCHGVGGLRTVDSIHCH
jgi:adenylate cyclase